MMNDVTVTTTRAKTRMYPIISATALSFFFLSMTIFNSYTPNKPMLYEIIDMNATCIE
jgi:hypothetical protein